MNRALEKIKIEQKNEKSAQEQARERRWTNIKYITRIKRVAVALANVIFHDFMTTTRIEGVCVCLFHFSIYKLSIILPLRTLQPEHESNSKVGACESQSQRTTAPEAQRCSSGESVSM